MSILFLCILCTNIQDFIRICIQILPRHGDQVRIRLLRIQSRLSERKREKRLRQLDQTWI